MNRTIRNLLIVIGIVVISLSCFLYNSNDVKAEDSTIGLSDTRIYGQDRFETSAKLSSQDFSESYYAVLVNGTNFADAITAAPIAYKMEAPVLLTYKDSIPNVITDELKRLKTKQVILIGGNGVISDSVVNQLNNLGISIYFRAGGEDRFDTSINVAHYLVPENDNAYVVKDDDWISALMVAPLSCPTQTPIIYGSDVGFKKSGADTLRNQNIKKFDIIGFSSNTDYYNNTAQTITDHSWYKDSTNINIITETSRENLNKKILDYYKDKFNFNTVYIVSDKSFADGLSVATLAGTTNSPIIFVNENNMSEIEKYIGENTDKIHNVKIIGGESLIPQDFMDKVWKYNSEIGGNTIPDFDDSDADVLTKYTHWLDKYGLTEEQATRIVREKTGDNSLESGMEGFGHDFDYTDKGINLSERRFWWFFDSKENTFLVDQESGNVYKMIENNSEKNIFQQM